MLALLIAQAALPDAPNATGIAGWTGAGLLGLVLYWLAFHHLPGKDKFLKELIDSHAEQTQTLITAHAAQTEILISTHNAKSEADRKEYRASMDRVTHHCEKELASITAALGEQLRSVRETVEDQKEEGRDLHQQTRHQLTNLAHNVGVKVAMGEIVVKPPPAPN